MKAKKTEKIENNVINLYSAWSDWVVYQTSDKKWWKHILNKEPVQIGHKSSQTSPYIPDTQKNFAVIGPWRIFGNSHSVFMDHHGGQDLYEDYTAILLENKDGISGSRELRDYDDHYPFNVQAILGNNENDIYIIFEEGYPEPIGLNIAHIKSTETEKISFSSGSKLNYNLIYNKQTNSKDIFPQYYRNSYGIYILYKNSIDFISFEGDKALSLFQSNGELSYIKSKTGELYIKEIKKETIVKFKLNPESSSLEKVNSIPDISDDIPQKKSITENTLYKSTTKNKDQKKTSVFMGDGVWLYSKGAINAVYTIDKNLYIFRNGKATLIKSFCDFYSSEVLRNSVFSLDGWIYINIRNSCFRFQPDNPQKLQEMNYEFGSPVFDNQSVIGFYKDSLCKFTWNSSKLDSIKKINNPYKCSNVIVTKDRYVYYNESDECIESVSKSGKDFKTISGKLPVIIRPGEFSPQIWENSGCIYFQSGTFNTLYSVLPNGKSLSEVVDSTCTPLCISNGKIYCVHMAASSQLIIQEQKSLLLINIDLKI
ncbi:MAG TPA: hypothetical protein VHT34_10730 [Clostridia bacterium]|nr:hypothetical protein [Clostridia bacterium]